MNEPRAFAKLSREDQTGDTVSVSFNRYTIKYFLKGRAFNLEEINRGIMITFPTIDQHLGFKASEPFHRAFVEVETDFDEQVEEFAVVKVDEETFIIELV